MSYEFIGKIAHDVLIGWVAFMLGMLACLELIERKIQSGKSKKYMLRKNE